MTDQGVFQVHRGIFDHPIFAPEPFTEREAWLWMLSAAAWANKRVRVGRHPIDLKRGQLAFALRFLAAKFQWTDSKVRRFLKRLETDAMIVVSATREATQVTICNYSQYQFGRRTDDAQTDAQTDEPPTRPRRKEEETNNYKKEESKKEAREPASDFEFEDFWKLWPNKVGKPAALRAFVSARKRADLDAIVAGVLAYIRDKPPDRPWLNPATFLNQNRWEDRPAQVANGRTQATENLSTVARRHAANGIAFGERPTTPSLCVVPSGTDVRLLPQGGSERSGDLRGGDGGGLKRISPGGD